MSVLGFEESDVPTDPFLIYNCVTRKHEEVFRDVTSDAWLKLSINFAFCNMWRDSFVCVTWLLHTTSALESTSESRLWFQWHTSHVWASLTMGQWCKSAWKLRTFIAETWRGDRRQCLWPYTRDMCIWCLINKRWVLFKHSELKWERAP